MFSSKFLFTDLDMCHKIVVIYVRCFHKQQMEYNISAPTI